MKPYDYVVIGGGVSGLYSALLLEQKRPGARVLLLEKNAYLGGRTRMASFHSKKVVTGAGVGRYPKDRLLMDLVARSGQDIRPVENRPCYQFSHPVPTLSFIESLKKKKSWIRAHRSHQTFRDFFLSFYTSDEYRSFCNSNGYTDFEKADIVDTLYDYGFEDNVPGKQIFPIDWNRLVRYLHGLLQTTHVLKNIRFVRYSRVKDDVFRVETSRGMFYTRNVIFAGSIERYPFPWVHEQVGYNSFMRMYAYYGGASDGPLGLHKSGTTYLDNILQKSIVVSPRVRMISYSDNHHADAVKKASDADLQELTGGAVFSDSVRFYWKRGTHYYRPLAPEYRDRDEFIRRAQNPEPGVFLVGECISRNQGWTEGALESVLAVAPLWFS